ncbi:hypothetical protein PBPRA0769 [Photobacterium profundum SS9]|uniref:Uncharacterized protein n=1 Tax=Photobacterium profundum (strain SS9) TaxID=298386 RepID=Q6LU43_PHOPR|nr:hypothetical protein PBPRA0769 [Photobacterium profundum SS9]
MLYMDFTQDKKPRTRHLSERSRYSYILDQFSSIDNSPLYLRAFLRSITRPSINFLVAVAYFLFKIEKIAHRRSLINLKFYLKK